MPGDTPRLDAPIRRFDVFAEWSRLVGKERNHLSEPDAEAYGYAVATIVAARKFGGHEIGHHPPQQVSEWRKRARKHDASEDWWRRLGSAEDFEQKIVNRMGRRFYEDVFRPAIRKAYEEGKHYEDIRDTLRAEWNGTIERGKRRV